MAAPPRVPPPPPTVEALTAALAHQLQLGAAAMAKLIAAGAEGTLIIELRDGRLFTCIDRSIRECLAVSPDRATFNWTRASRSRTR